MVVAVLVVMDLLLIYLQMLEFLELLTQGEVAVVALTTTLLELLGQPEKAAPASLLSGTQFN